MTDLFGRTAREEAVDALHSLTAIYTHEPVVDELLDSIAAVWPRRLARLLDPSVGAGAFICHEGRDDDTALAEERPLWPLQPPTP